MSANIIMCSVQRNKINLFTKEKVKHPEHSLFAYKVDVIKTLVISCHHSGRDTPINFSIETERVVQHCFDQDLLLCTSTYK